MKGIHIHGTGSAIPKKRLTNDYFQGILDTSDEWIRTRTGIQSRHVCDEEAGENVTTLAIEAAKKAVESSGVRVDQIGVVIVATSTAQYRFPSTACLVQQALGLKEETAAFDLSAACTGFLYGLQVCRGLLLSMENQYGLIVGCEQMSSILDYSDRSTCVLFGDGAGAAVVSLDDSLYLQRTWTRGNAEVLSCPIISKRPYLSMEGNKVFRFAVEVLQSGIDTVLADAGLDMEDIDYVVCHQANERIIEHVRKKYPGQEEKFFMNIAEYANTSAASIPIALDILNQKKQLKSGMKIICVGFGAGLTWSSALITL